MISCGAVSCPIYVHVLKNCKGAGFRKACSPSSTALGERATSAQVERQHGDTSYAVGGRFEQVVTVLMPCTSLFSPKRQMQCRIEQGLLVESLTHEITGQKVAMVCTRSLPTAARLAV